ncbi:MAG: PLP-dependent aminotransferase family protein [Sneathiellales bacterium]|nr:PLP-dependent aminotransferase family protein [Sneathiellales bacterium]
MSWQDKFSLDAKSIQASEIRELLKILEDPEILSFAGGIPDPDLFPMDRVKAIRDAMEEDPVSDRQSMQYSQTEGFAPLRDWVAENVSTPLNRIERDNILITNGAQQSLTLLSTILLEAGTKLAVASPTYLGALQVFGTRRPQYVTVQTDEDGIIPDSLEEAFKAGATFFYTVPDFQNPGGMTIPEDRRREIIRLAHQYNVGIIEDTAYRALYYDAPPPPSLLDIDCEFVGEGNWQEKGLVIQLGTASKTLMPALRVGWTIAPKVILEKLVLLKQANDLHTSTVNQIVTFELLSNDLDAHVEKLRNVYRQRKDAMLDALRQYLPNSATFTAPGGGMFVWIMLPEGLDAKHLLKKSLEEEKIAFVPGGAFYADEARHNTLRLSFSTCSPDVIRDGMRRLSALIQKEHLAKVA